MTDRFISKPNPERFISKPNPEKLKEVFDSENKKLESFILDRGEKALLSKAKLFSKEIEELKKTNIEKFAVELVLICIDIQFFIDEKDLIRLKELGISRNINKFLINHSKISEALREVLSPKKNQKKFLLFLMPTKIMGIIESHAVFNIMVVILRELLPISLKTGNQTTPYNYFTSFIHAVKKRKGTFSEVFHAFQNIDDTKINTKRSQKIVERLAYKYYCFDSIDAAKLTEGKTEKIILSKLFDYHNYEIITAYEINPKGFSITEKDIIMRFYPILNLVLPGLIKDDLDYEKSSEKQNKVAHSKVYNKEDNDWDFEEDDEKRKKKRKIIPLGHEELEQKRKDDVSIGYSKKKDDHNIENIKSKLFGNPKK